MSCQFESAVEVVDRMSVGSPAYSAMASSMVATVDDLASTMAIAKRRPNALEAVVIPSQNPYTLVLACHDMNEGTSVVQTTSLAYYQR